MVRINDYTFGEDDTTEGTGGRDYLQLPDEQGGGGSRQGGGAGTGGRSTTITQSGDVFNIISNIKGAVVLINGVTTGKTTPAQITISKTDLIGGDKTITLSKGGYHTNEKYVVSLNTNNTILVKNDVFEEGYGGLTQTEITCQYYVNNKVLNTIVDYKAGNLKTLQFKLNTIKGDDLIITKHNLNVSLSGINNGNPILIRKNNSKRSILFPTMGATTYVDFTNTKYKIESADLSLYRITKITYNNKFSRYEPQTAGDTESLTLDLILDSDYSINIEVEDVSKVVPPLKPMIKLLDNNSRLYNINTEIGVPIAFEKNSAVEAITIIVGDDILEFDDLEQGKVAGVVIPHSTFKKIGKYNIEIFPFSLNDYGESEVAPTPPIKPAPIKPIFDIKEEPAPNNNTIPIQNTNPNTGNNIQQQPTSYVNYAPNIGSNIPPPNTTYVVQGGGGSDSYDS